MSDPDNAVPEDLQIAGQVRRTPKRSLVELAVLLEHTGPVYGGETWPEAVATLMALTSEREIIETLRAVLARGEAFDQPVVVDAATHELGNGMHRIAASILAGASHIEVADDWAEDDVDLIEVSFKSDAPSDPSDDADDLFAAVRSFPLQDRWVEALGLSSNGDLYRGTYSCEGALTDALCQELERRVRRVGHSFDLVAAVLVDDEGEPITSGQLRIGPEAA